MEGSSFHGDGAGGAALVVPELVGRLVELGILRPGGAEAPYEPGDVRRVRLVDACERAGLSLEGIGSAIADGRLSLAFLDLVSLAGRPLTDTTYAELCGDRPGPAAPGHPAGPIGSGTWAPDVRR